MLKYMQLEAMTRRDVMLKPCQHVAVATEEEDPVATRLRKAVRAFRRSSSAQERDRKELREAILAAASAGKGTTEITKLIDREYTEAHVSRVIHGKA